MKNIKGASISDADYDMLVEVFTQTQPDEHFEDWARDRIFEMRDNDSDNVTTSNRGKKIEYRYAEDVQMPDYVESADSSIQRVRKYPALRKVMLKEKYQKLVKT